MAVKSLRDTRLFTLSKKKMPSKQSIPRISKYGFVGLILLLSIPFTALALVYGILGVQSDGHTVNRVFEANRPFANVSISAHMLFGSIIMSLAPIQLLMGWARKWLKTHKILGYIFTLASIITGLGGFVYVIIHGTTGGIPMDIAFFIYGVLLLIATFQTIQFARRKDILKHNEWERFVVVDSQS